MTCEKHAVLSLRFLVCGTVHWWKIWRLWVQADCEISDRAKELVVNVRDRSNVIFRVLR